jgi:hypothetical protein
MNCWNLYLQLYELHQKENKQSSILPLLNALSSEEIPLFQSFEVQIAVKNGLNNSIPKNKLRTTSQNDAVFNIQYSLISVL